MIETTYNGTDCLLINDAPNWGAGFNSTHESITDSQSSLTRIETRRAFTATLRTGLSFKLTLSGAALRQAQLLLRNLKAQPVLIPFWPAVSLWVNRAAMGITGGLMVTFAADWSAFTIYPYGSEPAPGSCYQFVAPLLQGFIKNQTDADWRNAQTATMPFDFTESSDPAYALSFAFNALTNGPQPTGYAAAPTLLPFAPDHRKVTESISVSIHREQVGFQREQQATFYPNQPWRSQQAQYTLSGAPSVCQLLAWFNVVASQGQSFWAASSTAACIVASPALSTDTTIAMTDANVQVGDWLGAFSPGGSVSSWAQVQSVAGNNVTFASAFGAAFATGKQLFPLSLARIASNKLLVKWLSPILAQASLNWSEVVNEEVIPANETLQTTVGKLTPRAILFQFSRNYRNGSVANWYFTSYEADLNYGGNSYIHGPFTCGDVESGLNLEEDNVTITSQIFSGNPLNDDVAGIAEAPLSVTVTFVDVAAGFVTNPQVVFTGDCSNFTRNGSKITANCKVGASLFETQLPRFIRGVVCNHLGGSNADGSFLISAGCTLLKANFKFTGTVAAPVSGAFPFTLHVAGLTPPGVSPTYFDNWFANGWVEWGTGVNIQRRGIIGSTTPVGGAIALTLHRWFKGTPILGDALAIYPGCDGLYTTCKAYDAANNPTGKFNNYLNFGAEPFTPQTNPSTAGMPNFKIQGSKK